jgi:hypothetical protein
VGPADHAALESWGVASRWLIASRCCYQRSQSLLRQIPSIGTCHVAASGSAHRCRGLAVIDQLGCSRDKLRWTGEQECTAAALGVTCQNRR